MTNDLWAEARELDDAYDADTKNDAARMARLALRERALHTVTKRDSDEQMRRAESAEARVADLEREVAGLRSVVAAVEGYANDLCDCHDTELCIEAAYRVALLDLISDAPSALAERDERVRAQGWSDALDEVERDLRWVFDNNPNASEDFNAGLGVGIHAVNHLRAACPGAGDENEGGA